MKKSFCLPIIFAFLLLFCLSCQEEPTAVQNDVSYQQGSGGSLKGRPGSTPPTCELSVRNPGSPVSLPGGKAYIDYSITASEDITEASICIIYDDNKDGGYEILFSERVLYIYINCDGVQTSMQGTIEWDGTVLPRCSQLPQGENKIFDHRGPGDNPDQYLLSFQVIAGGKLTYNWASPENVPDRVLVNPTQCPAPFSVESITAIPSPARSKKGNYAAALSAEVKCTMPSFEGGGQWQQSTDNGITWGGLKNYDGCPNCGFKDDDGDKDASTTNTLLVGSGRYRYALKLLYDPFYYYAPNDKLYSNEVIVP